MDLFKNALSAFGKGEIGLGAVLSLAALILFAQLAGKLGEKAVASVKGLLTEGEKLRLTLHGQLEESLARAVVLQRARDEAINELALARAELATYRARYEAMLSRLEQMEGELNRTLARLQEAQRNIT